MTAAASIRYDRRQRVLVLRLPAMPAAFEVWRRRTERRLERIDRARAARRTTVRDLQPTMDDSAIDAWATALVAGLKAARRLG